MLHTNAAQALVEFSNETTGKKGKKARLEAVQPKVKKLSAKKIRPSVSWADQNETLKTMWLGGDTPEAIAAKLERSVSAVMTQAVRLGLQRRLSPGRKPRPLALPHLHKMVKVPNKQALLDNVCDFQSAMDAKRKMRVCLMCVDKFESAGPHNRICAPCKESSAYMSATRLGDNIIAFGDH
jgi:hypothetical protein